MPDRRQETRVRIAVLAVVILMLFGTIGYRIIEGWPWFDCFYMTIITLATIGYTEPQGITAHGRYFTAVLIVMGVWTVAYSISVLTHMAVQGELVGTWERRRVQDRIRKLKDHFIICGIGRVGQRVAQGLAAEGVDFVIVEVDRHKVETVAERDWLVVYGDATQEDVLERAGIGRARGLVAALPTDADNVFIVLTARDVSERLVIVARVNNESAVPKMRKAGASKVISPLETGAHQILQALLRPSVARFIELATMTEGLDLVIEEMTIAAGSPLAGRMLRDTNLRSAYNVIIIAVVRVGGEMIFNPNAETAVHVGDKIIAMGKGADIEGLEQVSLGESATAS
jgi:voltage-gated potassium channel